MQRTGICLFFATLVAGTAQTDDVFFKSGDRLTGTVKKVEDGKMTFASKVAGTLTLKMKDIRTFSTDGPIQIELADGTALHEKAVPAEEGTFRIQPTEKTTPPQAVAFDRVARITSEKPRWKGAVTASALLARGNTRSDTASITADAVKRRANDRITLGGGYRFADQYDVSTGDKNTTEDSWHLKGKYDYFFSKKFYSYTNVKYEKDRIANLVMRLSPGIGLGRQWIERPDFSLLTEGGLSSIHEEYSDPNDTRDYIAARFAYQIEKQFNTYVSGFHNLEYLPSMEFADTFLVNADIGLRAKLTDQWMVEAKAQMEHNSKPSDGRDNNDLRYTLGLGYTF